MTRPFSDRAKAKEAGRKGGKASAKRHLTLERVEAELSELSSLEDAQRWLRQLAPASPGEAGQLVG